VGEERRIKSLRGLSVSKAQEEQHFHTHDEAKRSRVRRREREQRLRPLRTWNSSKSRKNMQKFRRSNASLWINRKDLDHWKVFTSRKEVQEEHIGRMDLDHHILSKIPDSHQI
jgi:hypothetical protein